MMSYLLAQTALGIRLNNILGDFMENKQKNFVKTTDEHTAEYLRSHGFVELPKEGSHWVFLNEVKKVDFNREDLKVNFSNMLCF